MEKNQDYKESKKVDRTLRIKRYDNIKNQVISDRIRYIDAFTCTSFFFFFLKSKEINKENILTVL